MRLACANCSIVIAFINTPPTAERFMSPVHPSRWTGVACMAYRKQQEEGRNQETSLRYPTFKQITFFFRWNKDFSSLFLGRRRQLMDIQQETMRTSWMEWVILSIVHTKKAHVKENVQHDDKYAYALFSRATQTVPLREIKGTFEETLKHLRGRPWWKSCPWELIFKTIIEALSFLSCVIYVMWNAEENSCVFWVSSPQCVRQISNYMYVNIYMHIALAVSQICKRSCATKGVFKDRSSQGSLISRDSRKLKHWKLSN